MNQEDAAQNALSLPIHASLPFTPSGVNGFGRLVQIGNAAATLGWLRHETPADVENTRRLLSVWNRTPEGTLEAIAEHESKRLGYDYGDAWEQLQSAYTFYIEKYSTDSPGYVGPVFLVLWPASPGAVSTFIQKNGVWEHCNSSAW